MNIFYYFSSLNVYKIPHILELVFIFIEGKMKECLNNTYY